MEVKKGILKFMGIEQYILIEQFLSLVEWILETKVH